MTKMEINKKHRVMIRASASYGWSTGPVDFDDFEEFKDYLGEKGIFKVNLGYYDIIDDTPQIHEWDIKADEITLKHFEWLVTKSFGRARHVEIISKHKIKEMNKEFIPKTGSKNFPENYDYAYNEKSNQAVIKLSNKSIKYKLRMFDCWGLAYVAYLLDKKNAVVKKLLYEIEGENLVVKSELEAFLRRISFLNINNNDLDIELKINGKYSSLYTKSELLERPSHEKVRRDLNERSSNDIPGRLEKDLQSFIYEIGNNKRLAYFGEDFFQLTGEKELGILREFPTGVFVNGNITEEDRILPTNFIDFVSFNKYKKLSIIELKVDDSCLEVISQLLDYALFFSCYWDQLIPVIKEELGEKNFPKGELDDFIAYVVNNRFHPRFTEIKRFYTNKDKNFGFELKQVVLGHIHKDDL